jgi:hypothetical protein
MKRSAMLFLFLPIAMTREMRKLAIKKRQNTRAPYRTLQRLIH